MDAHPEMGLSHGRQVVFETDPPGLKNPLGESDNAFRVLSGADFVGLCCSVGGNPVATPTAVVRTSLQKKLGGYRKELPHTADMELWLRFAIHASVGMIDAVQAFKRNHAGNMQHQYVGPALPDLRQRQAAFQVLFREFGPQLRDADRLRHLAACRVAGDAFWSASQAFDNGHQKACRDLLRFAVEIDPEIRRRPEWGRLRWKRCLGPRVWRVLRPLVDRLRGRRDAPTCQEKSRG
jgi:hypothetical protein